VFLQSNPLAGLPQQELGQLLLELPQLQQTLFVLFKFDNFFLGLESTQLALRVQAKRAQLEVH